MAAGRCGETSTQGAVPPAFSSNHDHIKRTVCGLLLEHGVVPVYISVVGSRAKGLVSEHSDFDVKVITLASRRDYMLQNVKSAFSFAGMAGEQEAEGTATDVLAAIKYITTGNAWAYEIFTGVCILTSTLAETLRESWVRTFSPALLHKAERGKLIGYIVKEKKIGRHATTATAKNAAEAAYLAVKLKHLASNSAPPPVNAFELLQSEAVQPREREWVIQLFQRRIKDKEAKVCLTPEFWALVGEALETETHQAEGGRQNEMEVVRQNLETAFLRSFE